MMLLAIHGSRLLVAFSLTPALSRWERERGIQPHFYPARSIHRTRADFLPLPAGEGWGEGERSQSWIVRMSVALRIYSPTDSERPQIPAFICGFPESAGNFFASDFEELT